MTTSRFARKRPQPATDDLGLTALVLAYGAASQLAASSPWQVPANLAAAAGAVAVARTWGASSEELGLDPGAIPGGLRLGVATLPPVCAVVALGLAIPTTRRFFADKRVSGSSGRELAYHALVRIPLATVIAEEVLFRSALLGVALHTHRRGRAVSSTAIAFGLWHIVPALRSHSTNAAGARLADRVGGRAATVTATVIVTATTGAGLAWLRLRSRSIAAPIVAHAGVNLAGLVAAAWVARRGSLSRR